MSSRTVKWLRPALLVIALSVGILVLTLSLVSGGSTEPGVEPTQTFTADEVSALSDRINATQEAVKGSVVAGLIERADSVVAVPHSSSTGRRIDPVMTLDAALVTADKLVTGRVVEQYLEWGVLDPFPDVSPVLVSVLVGPDGETNRVAQAVDVGDAPDITGLRLTYLEGHQLLQFNETYAVLVVNDQNQMGRLLLIRGHAYVIQAAGTLLPGQSITPRDSLPSTEQSLESQFAGAKIAGGSD